MERVKNKMKQRIRIKFNKERKHIEIKQKINRPKREEKLKVKIYINRSSLHWVIFPSFLVVFVQWSVLVDV